MEILITAEHDLTWYGNRLLDKLLYCTLLPFSWQCRFFEFLNWNNLFTDIVF